MTRLLIVGPPGAGKGTQAARVCEYLDVPTISTGDIFRRNIAEGTELGKQVKAIVDNGDYVPDELTNALVKDRLEQADADGGFLLDGYPRTPDQVAYLDGLLASHGHSLDAVLQLVADPEELVRRLRQRAGEQGRADDSEEAIRHRQAVYQRETQPLLEIFRDRELLLRVDGLGTVDEVWERIRAALSARGIARAA
ncbi:adenylate kinase [Pseudolysinimonas kribbensis]|uniref:Adenylate kinase n=1 Tax=Pseudolysinimonas kribbensis TaxID=433641 RepID=A0ABQ6K4X3_9MICO|nr:adenylate kinase [Pseudolysinimonas kribbensis]GMA95681.1 adenylate kinase [Pseudolysinimonas kribbensis]